MFNHMRIWHFAWIILLSNVAYGEQGYINEASLATAAANSKKLSPTQTLIQEKHWHLDTLIAQTRNDVYKVQRIPAEEKENTEQRRYVYGNQLKLSEDGTFRSYYTAWCGNDCFRNFQGRFEVLDGNHIHFHLTRASQSKMCENFDREENLDLGTFLVSPSEDGFYLIRSDKPQTDAQQLRYWELLAPISLATLGQLEQDKRLLDISIEYRNRSPEEILQQGLKLDGRFDSKQAQLRFVSTDSVPTYVLYLFEINQQLKVGAYHPGASKFVVLDI